VTQLFSPRLGTSQNPLPARRVAEQTSDIREIEKLFPSTARLRSELTLDLLDCAAALKEKVDDARTRNEPNLDFQSKGELTAATAGLLRIVPTLSYEDLRGIIGRLHLIRSDDARIAGVHPEQILEPTPQNSLGTQSALEKLRQMFSSFHDIASRNAIVSEKPSGNPQIALTRYFCADATILLRMTYPLGINIIDPQWTRDRNSSSIAARGVSIIRLSCDVQGEQIVLKSDAKQTQARVLKAQQRWQDGEGSEVILHEGQVATAGRGLSIRTPVGIELNHSYRAEVELPVTDGHWSRGALRICRFEGRLFLFDSGSLHSLNVMHPDIRDERGHTYIPRTVVSQNGDWSYGERQL
jgi:hypothetical protein